MISGKFLKSGTINLTKFVFILYKMVRNPYNKKEQGGGRSMVVRMAFLGHAKQGNIEKAYQFSQLNESKLLYQQRFVCQDLLVVYVEWEAESEEQARRIVLEKLADNTYLHPIGLGGQPFAAMEMIFSYNRPRDAAHWQRKEQGKACGAIAHIRPGKLGSYVYYHHILQETTVRIRDKYGAIFVFGNILFYYREQPGEQEFPWYRGSVQGDIPANWGALMQKHFSTWQDGETGWKEMKGGGQICVTN